MDYYSTNDSGYERPNYYASRATRSPSQSRVLAEDSGLRKDVIFIFLLTQLNPVALSRAPWLTPKDAPVGLVTRSVTCGLDFTEIALGGFARIAAFPILQKSSLDWRKIELGLEGNLGAGPSGLFGFVGYDGFEAGYGLVKGNAGEVDVDNNGEEVEDDDVEIKLGEVEGVVELAAEVVVTGAGVRLAEVVGDFGCDLGVIEEGERRRLGGGE
nr:hypothetical protein Iba_chr05cCG0060 [Ipomoea batatas]